MTQPEKRAAIIYRHGCGSLSADESLVSLPRLPFEDSSGKLDLRRETAPRGRAYMVGTGISDVERNICTIRAALRDYRAEVANG